MSKIGIQFKKGYITGFADESSAVAQLKLNDDWILVERDSSFSVTEMFRWTIRTEDNKLVHKDNMLTSEEESHKSTKELTDIVLSNSNDIEDIKKSVMLLTNMQLNPDTTSITGGN